MGHLTLACHCLLAGVFAVSAGSKLRGRAAFRAFAWSVRRLRLVPYRHARTLAPAVAGAEVATALLLLLPSAAGLIAAALLLAAFTVAIVVGVRRGVHEPCRCFGASETPLGVPHIVRNAVLLAVAVTGTAGHAVHAEPFGDPAGTAVAVTAAGVALLLVLFFDDLAALFARPTNARSTN